MSPTEIASKKLELIEWLIHLKDESAIRQIEEFKKSMTKNIYEHRTSVQIVHEKLTRSEQAIQTGKTLTQNEVEFFFKSKFGR